MSSKYSFALIWLSVAYVVFLLIEVWVDIVSEEIFGKITITYIVIMLLLGFIIAIRRDVGDEKKLKKDKLVN